jgi:hypothetical protein
MLQNMLEIYEKSKITAQKNYGRLTTNQLLTVVLVSTNVMELNHLLYTASIQNEEKKAQLA